MRESIIDVVNVYADYCASSSQPERPFAHTEQEQPGSSVPLIRVLQQQRSSFRQSPGSGECSRACPVSPSHMFVLTTFRSAQPKVEVYRQTVVTNDVGMRMDRESDNVSVCIPPRSYVPHARRSSLTSLPPNISTGLWHAHLEGRRARLSWCDCASFLLSFSLICESIDRFISPARGSRHWAANMSFFSLRQCGLTVRWYGQGIVPSEVRFFSPARVNL